MQINHNVPATQRRPNAAALTGMSLAAVAAWSNSAAAQVEFNEIRSGAWSAEIGTNGLGVTNWSNNSGGPDHAQTLTYFVGVTEDGDAEEDIYRLTGGSGFGTGNFFRPVEGDDSRLIASYDFFEDGDGYGSELLFDLSVEYGIRGNTTDGSVITEEVLITPQGASRGFDVRLFAYDDYDLDGDRFGDVGQRTTNTSYRQLTQSGTFVDTTAASFGSNAARTFYFNEIVDTEVSLFNTLDINGQDPADAGFPQNAPVLAGPGDVEHVYTFGSFRYDAGADGFSDLAVTTERKGFFADVVLPDDDDDEDGNPQFTFREENPNRKGEPPRFYDPFVAVGYDYEITQGGDGNGFAELFLSSGFTDGEYLLTITDEDHPLFGQQFTVTGDNVSLSFDFTEADAEGVDSFRVEGIEPNAMIDPEDEMGFPTGLTFVNGDSVVFTQTPITQFIPEPASAGLLAAGGLLALRRRR